MWNNSEIKKKFFYFLLKILFHWNCVNYSKNQKMVRDFCKIILNNLTVIKIIPYNKWNTYTNYENYNKIEEIEMNIKKCFQKLKILLKL